MTKEKQNKVDKKTNFNCALKLQTYTILVLFHTLYVVYFVTSGKSVIFYGASCI